MANSALGPRFVGHEDDVFEDLRCLRKLRLPDEIIRSIASYYCVTSSTGELPSGLDLLVVTQENNWGEDNYRPERCVSLTLSSSPFDLSPAPERCSFEGKSVLPS